MTDEQIEELERLAREATPGPWGHDPGDIDSTIVHQVDPELAPHNDGPHLAEADELADAAYIAAASPDVVLGLIERIREAEKLADERLDRNMMACENPCGDCAGCHLAHEESLNAE